MGGSKEKADELSVVLVPRACFWKSNNTTPLQPFPLLVPQDINRRHKKENVGVKNVWGILISQSRAWTPQDILHIPERAFAKFVFLWNFPSPTPPPQVLPLSLPSPSTPRKLAYRSIFVVVVAPLERFLGMLELYRAEIVQGGLFWQQWLVRWNGKV